MLASKDKKYLERIINCFSKIIRYLEEVTSIEKFEFNEEKIDAALLNLEQIGETANKLTEEFKASFSTIEWNKIIGLSAVAVLSSITFFVIRIKKIS